MAYDAGTATLTVTASFKDLEKDLKRIADKMGDDFRKGFGGVLPKTLSDAVQKAGPASSEAAAKVGAAVGRTFAAKAQQGVARAFASIPDADRVLAPIRRELELLSKVDLGKGFDEKDFINRVDKVYAALRQAQADARTAGRFSNAGSAAAELGATREIVRAARERGFEAGDAFGNAYRARLAAIRKILPDLQLTNKSTPDERRAASLRQRATDISGVNVGDRVTKDNNPLGLRVGARVLASDLQAALEILEGQLDQFAEQAGTVELQVAADKARIQAGAFFEDIKTQAQKAAEAQAKAQQEAQERQQQLVAKAYEDAIKQQYLDERRLRDEFSKVYDAAVKEDFLRRRRVEDDFNKAHDAAIKEGFLRQRRAQDDFNKAHDAAVKEQFLRDRKALDDFGKTYDDALREQLRREKQARERAAAETEKLYRKTSAGKASSGVQGAAAALPRVPIVFDNTIEDELAQVRRRLSDLGDLRIGIDLDGEDFADQVQREFNRLRAIAKDQDVQITVRTDAATAAAELGKVLVAMDRITAKKAKIKIEADKSAFDTLTKGISVTLGRLGALIAIGASIGTAIVPAAAAATGAIAALGTAALGAGAGIGVMLLGFSGIGDALGALGQAADEPAKASTAAAKAIDRTADALDRVRAAERALANTRANNRDAAIRAEEAVQDAVADVARARRLAVRDQQDALERVSDSTRTLRRDEMDATKARQSLNQAYRDAKRALEDLDLSVRGNALNQRQATLDIAAAKEELNKVKTNPRATAAEREQADITYKQQLLQMDDLRLQGERLIGQQIADNTKGINKSDQVVEARERIREADERVADSQRRLARAREDVDDAAVNGTERIREAQESLADAIRDQGIQQREAAYSLVSAQESLLGAQRDLARAYDDAGTAGTAAVDRVKVAMNKLSPTGQKFVRFVFGLRDELRLLRDAASDGMLDGLMTAITNLIGSGDSEIRKNMAPLLDFVGRVSTAIGNLFIRFSDTLKGPTFRAFFDYIDKTAVQSLNNLFTAGENLMLGFINLFLALTPLTGDVEKGFLGATESFRKWSEGLSTNAGFQRFVEYVRDSGPRVAELIGQISKTFVDLVKAAAPVGTAVLAGLTKVFDLVNSIPQDVLNKIVAGVAVFAGVIAVFAGVTTLLALSTAGVIAGIAAALAAILATLYSKVEFFRDGVDRGIRVIGAAATWLYENAIKPAIDAIATAFRWLFDNIITPLFQGFVTRTTVFREGMIQLYNDAKPTLDRIGAAFTWLYDKAIGPALTAIGGALKAVYDNVIKPILALWNADADTVRAQQATAFSAVATIFRSLGGALKAVYESVLRPVFSAIGAGAVFLWENAIVPAFNGIRAAVQFLAPIFLWFYRNVVRPVFGLIASAVSVAWDVLKVIFGRIRVGFRVMGVGLQLIYKTIIKPVWTLVAAIVQVAWGIIRVIFGLIKINFKILAGGMYILYRSTIKPTWDLISKIIRWAWEKVIKPAFDNTKKGIDRLGAAFRSLYNTYILPTWRDKVKPLLENIGRYIDVHIKPKWEAAVKGLGGIWKGLKDSLTFPIRFTIDTLLNKGLLAGYNKLAKLFKVKPDNVQIPVPKFATGGRITGPGTPTSDSILIRASRDEHMLTAAEVAAAGGHQAIYAWRKALLQGRGLPGFANGGRIGDGYGAWFKKTIGSIKNKAGDVFTGVKDFVTNPTKAIQDLLAKLIAKLPGRDSGIGALLAAIPRKIVDGLGNYLQNNRSQDEGVAGTPGSEGGLGGSAGMMRILRQVFPGLPLISGFRPGAITATGNPSMHGKNRAVDLQPRMDVFEWIKAHFPQSHELIFSPAGRRQLYRGAPHVYSGITKQMHYCVPMDTEILTRRGWLTHDQLVDGDETPGLNFDTGQTEWTPIRGVVRYAEAELYEAKSHSWAVRSTLGHRWVARDPATGRFYWNTTGGDVEGDDQPAVRKGRHQHSWVIAAEMADGPGLDVDDDEAELLGWLFTDGGQHDGMHKGGVNFSIHVWQTKEVGVARLRTILGDRASWNGKGFRLRNKYSRDLLARAGIKHIKDRDQMLAMIYRMTAAQRQLMLVGVIGGDGTSTGKSKSWKIATDLGPRLEVVTTLSYLCGYRTTVVKHRCSPSCWKHNGTPMQVFLGKPVVSTYRQGRTPVGNYPVWCPITDLGSWTARFNNNIVLTGNSHVHWSYDKGGEIPDTRNMPGGVMQIFHGKRQPDKVLTDSQWTNMATLAQKARTSMTGGDTVFNFRDQSLDMDRLRSLYERRDALDRVNRSNW